MWFPLVVVSVVLGVVLGLGFATFPLYVFFRYPRAGEGREISVTPEEKRALLKHLVPPLVIF